MYVIISICMYYSNLRLLYLSGLPLRRPAGRPPCYPSSTRCSLSRWMAILLRMCNIHTYIQYIYEVVKYYFLNVVCMHVCMYERGLSLLVSYAGDVLPLRLHIQSPTDSQAR